MWKRAVNCSFRRFRWSRLCSARWIRFRLRLPWIWWARRQVLCACLWQRWSLRIRKDLPRLWESMGFCREWWLSFVWMVRKPGIIKREEDENTYDQDYYTWMQRRYGACGFWACPGDAGCAGIGRSGFKYWRCFWLSGISEPGCLWCGSRCGCGFCLGKGSGSSFGFLCR